VQAQGRGIKVSGFGDGGGCYDKHSWWRRAMRTVKYEEVSPCLTADGGKRKFSLARIPFEYCHVDTHSSIGRAKAPNECLQSDSTLFFPPRFTMSGPILIHKSHPLQIQGAVCLVLFMLGQRQRSIQGKGRQKVRPTLLLELFDRPTSVNPGLVFLVRSMNRAVLDWVGRSARRGAESVFYGTTGWTRPAAQGTGISEAI